MHLKSDQIMRDADVVHARQSAESLQQGQFTTGARIVVHVVGPEQGFSTTKTFINPPKSAATILERLTAFGFSGDLQDSEGKSLSSTDPLDDSQEYRLTCPTGKPACSIMPGQLQCFGNLQTTVIVRYATNWSL